MVFIYNNLGQYIDIIMYSLFHWLANFMDYHYSSWSTIDALIAFSKSIFSCSSAEISLIFSLIFYADALRTFSKSIFSYSSGEMTLLIPFNFLSFSNFYYCYFSLLSFSAAYKIQSKPWRRICSMNCLWFKRTL